MSFIQKFKFTSYPSKIKNNSIEQNHKIKNKIDTENDDNYDYDCESTQKKHKIENILLGSLAVLATFGGVHVLTNNENHYSENYYQYTVNDKNDYENITCKPELLAIGGEHDSVMERNEFMDLLWEYEKSP